MSTTATNTVEQFYGAIAAGDLPSALGILGDRVNRVSRCDRSLLNDAQVSAGEPDGGEPPRQQRIAVSQAELEARQTRLTNLKDRAADAPKLTDVRLAHLRAAQREVLTEGSGA